MLAGMMRFRNEILEKGFDDRSWGVHPMLGLMGFNSGAFWLVWILWFVSWVLIIVVLIAFARWLWKKGDQEERRGKNR